MAQGASIRFTEELCKAYELHKAHGGFCAGHRDWAYLVIIIAAVVTVVAGTTSSAGVCVGQYVEGPVRAVLSRRTAQ